MKQKTIYKHFELHYFDVTDPRPKMLYFDKIVELKKFLTKNKSKIIVIKVLRCCIESILYDEINYVS